MSGAGHSDQWWWRRRGMDFSEQRVLGLRQTKSIAVSSYVIAVAQGTHFSHLQATVASLMRAQPMMRGFSDAPPA
jgi:hypothetical protein